MSRKPEEAGGSVPVQQYPYLVVRMMAAVYQREQIEIRIGEPLVQVGYRSSFVSHPTPFDTANHVSAACRQLLIDGVLEAVQRTRFRMCIVWAAEECTFVERDGSVLERDAPPSGGYGSGGVGGTPLPTEIDFGRSPVPYVECEQRRPS